MQKRERHGMTQTPEYKAWENMLARCYRESYPGYRRYGGRGIAVCQQWRESFLAFLRDVGKRPHPSLSLERKDNDRNYEPGNVVWTSRTRQQRNKSNNRLLTYRGQTKPLIDWADELGLSYRMLEARWRRGWTPEQILKLPPHKGRRLRPI